MPNTFDQLMILSTLVFFSGLLISYFILSAIYKSNKNFLPWLHVKAEKSQSNALLLGGLALGASALTTMSILLLFYSQELSAIENLVLKSSIFPLFAVILYGFLDDKYEIRARHKLFLQMVSILSFVLPLNTVLYHGNPYSLMIATVFGLAFINGSNLIDGLDTIFAKVGIVTSIGFIFLAFQMSSIPALAFSVMTTGALISFYYFNKEPAKIYAGEIGGSLLGMLFFIQANLLLGKHLSFANGVPTIDIIAKVLIVSIYPLSELAITFSRRLVFRQSPFRGDHLHIHHIIKSNFNLRATKTANIISAIILMTTIVGFLSLEVFSAHIAVAVSVVMISGIYTSVCFRHWKKLYSKKYSNDIFLNLNEKMIHVIDGRAIESLYTHYQVSAFKESDDIAV